MRNPFSRIVNMESDPVKKKYLEDIKKISMVIVKKTITGKLLKSDVDDYEKLVKAYDKKYPNEKDLKSRMEKVKKLRRIAL